MNETNEAVNDLGGVDYVSLSGFDDDGDDGRTWDGTSVLDPEPNAGFVITGARKSASPSKQTPCVELDLKCIDGVNKGRESKTWYYLTRKAISRFRHIRQVCAVPVTMPGETTQLAAFVGKQFRAQVINEVYEKKSENMMYPGQEAAGGITRKTTHKIRGERPWV